MSSARSSNVKKLKALGLVLAVLVLAGCQAGREDAAPQTPTAELKGVTLALELARTSEERARGLSDHQPLTDTQGMLFIFPDKAERTFWMKDMRFPLDIIWLEDDRVANISRNLPPEGETPQKTYRSDAAVNYVLEVPAGWADRHRLEIGDRIIYHL